MVEGGGDIGGVRLPQSEDPFHNQKVHTTSRRYSMYRNQGMASVKPETPYHGQ